MWKTEVDRFRNYNSKSNLKTSPSSILVEARLLQLFNISPLMPLLRLETLIPLYFGTPCTLES